MTSTNCITCYDQDLDLIIYQTKITLNKLSDIITKSILNGYSCDKSALLKSYTLAAYLRVLEDENRKQHLGAEPCLSKDKLQTIFERIRKSAINCSLETRQDQLVDKSGKDAWIANHPACVSRESWERIAYRICKAFNLDVRVIKDSNDDCELEINVLSKEQICDLSFEVVRNLIPCDIIIAISVYKEMCDLDLKITRTEEECKIDFDILRSQLNCDLDLKTYRSLIACNLSFDVIRTVYQNGCSFVQDGAEVLLVSALNKYPLSSLNFNGQINPANIKKFNIQKSEYLKNPKSFIDKLKSDYGK